jgi:hypothetical protein
MEAIVSVVAAQGRRLTARDYKTLCLATLGGLLEFYDFIILAYAIFGGLTPYLWRGCSVWIL